MVSWGFIVCLLWAASLLTYATAFPRSGGNAGAKVVPIADKLANHPSHVHFKSDLRAVISTGSDSRPAAASVEAPVPSDSPTTPASVFPAFQIESGGAALWVAAVLLLIGGGLIKASAGYILRLRPAGSDYYSFQPTYRPTSPPKPIDLKGSGRPTVAESRSSRTASNQNNKISTPGCATTAGRVPVPRPSSGAIRVKQPRPEVVPGWVSTLAGNGEQKKKDGTGVAASFNHPTGLAVGGSGTVYVADQENHMIRKISPEGDVTTLAGSTSEGAADGAGPAASFSRPVSLAVDASGNLYVADQNNHKIRKIGPDGMVTTLAGSSIGAVDGPAGRARFNYPTGVAVDAAGTVYVADRFNHLIRRITPDGQVSTLAGNGQRGDDDGPGTEARFNYPTSVAVDGSGIVYVADQENHRIRRISPEGVVSTLAGRDLGCANGAGVLASFRYPSGVAMDATTGNIVVADQSNHKIRRVSPTGQVTTLAGRGGIGAADGGYLLARFFRPSAVAVDASGNVYVADRHNHRIRRIQGKVG
jgi:sugar lactone lactonase YvrE